MSDFTISDHAVERVRKRLGLPKRSVPLEVQRAFDEGLRRPQVKGRLKAWMDRQCFTHRDEFNTEPRIYRGYLWVFSQRRMLLTVYEVPKEHRARARAQEAER